MQIRMVLSCLRTALCSISTSDWINIGGVFANLCLTIYIVKVVQNKLTNRRVLKDHLINELKELRTEYRSWIDDYSRNKINSSQVIPWFKLMNIKTADLMKILEAKYEIDVNLLNPFQIELREIITDDDTFIQAFSSKTEIHLSKESQNTLIRFQQQHNHIFNDIIIGINNSKNNS